MELDAADIKGFMAEGHHLSLIADSSDFEAIGEILIRHHPRVITADGDIPFYATENRIVAHDMTGGSDTVEDIRQILQLATKDLTYGLMTQADTQDGFLAGIGTDDVEQQACLTWDARARREDNLAIGFEVGEFELVVTHNGDLCAQLLH